eukprot:TRINITY_DN14427_c0_g1_i1.p1 TRINITY_DN14427_c0_g1~~TRINITY_DN14427_c0_g1_i1.p1  ORF type:complete len:103 (-),score=7.94 TRINITY_DN14427_c0_g1_i1:29-337(-)
MCKFEEGGVVTRQPPGFGPNFWHMQAQWMSPEELMSQCRSLQKASCIWSPLHPAAQFAACAVFADRHPLKQTLERQAHCRRSCSCTRSSSNARAMQLPAWSA